MKYKKETTKRASALIGAAVILLLASRWINADTGTCGGPSITLPFTDVQAANVFFCSIAQAYFTGLTNGTTATTYSPSDPVPREQMAAFITRTQDSSLKRGSRRAALKQWWTPAVAGAMGVVSLNNDTAFPTGITCDGTDLWVTLLGGDIKRVHASDGKVLQTWSAAGAQGLIVAAGKIYIAGVNGNSPGKIFVIDPAGTPGPAATFENSIGVAPLHITFDGTNLWTANQTTISRVAIATGIDSTFNAGFSGPRDILWDGSNLWVVDFGDSHLKLVDVSSGAVVQSVAVVSSPRAMGFDGTNIWVCGGDETTNNVSVVRAIGGLRGTVLATLQSGSNPRSVAFDGERVLITNLGGNSVSLFKAADFTPLVTVPTASQTPPFEACSDGLNFWITVGSNPATLLRF